MARVYTAAIRTLALAGLVFSVYLAATRPLGENEARIWHDLVRPPLSEAVRAPDAWSGIFYAVLAERVIGVFRLSAMSLRVPAILAGALCGGLLWHRRSDWLAASYLIGVAAGCFSTANGFGMALALWCLAVRRRSGWIFGLAIAASPPFAVLGMIWWRIKDIERILIPAATLALILLLIPLSHAGRTPPTDWRPEFERERHRRNAAISGGFQPLTFAGKSNFSSRLQIGHHDA
jgi:hypothetical protein